MGYKVFHLGAFKSEKEMAEPNNRNERTRLANLKAKKRVDPNKPKPEQEKKS